MSTYSNICMFPEITGTNKSYHRGCDCRACVTAHTQHGMKYEKENPRGVAGRILRNSRSRAGQLGYLPIDMSIDDMEQEVLHNCVTRQCEHCGRTGCVIPKYEQECKLFADHCHKTGEFRGFLCPSCNRLDVLAK